MLTSCIDAYTSRYGNFRANNDNDITDYFIPLRDNYRAVNNYHIIREIFRWIKILPSPATFGLQKKFTEKIFGNVVKVAISSMQS